MIALLFTLAFIAAAVLALATIAASFAKGLAAASELRQQLALCADTRMITVRHRDAVRQRPVIAMRPLRRSTRPMSAPVAPARRTVAA